MLLGSSTFAFQAPTKPSHAFLIPPCAAPLDRLLADAPAFTAFEAELDGFWQAGDSAGADAALGALLAEVDAPLPWWARTRRLPLAAHRWLPSKRVRRGALQRLVDAATPDADDAAQDDAAEAVRRRRQRAMAVVLRASLAGGVDVRAAERRASQALASETAEDMAARTPAGLETPTYEVLVRRGANLQVRRYAAFATAGVAMGSAAAAETSLTTAAARSATSARLSEPRLPGASAFGSLAGYLFGKNEPGVAMAMTTPVISTLDAANGFKPTSMRFVLPSAFWDQTTNGNPSDGNDVSSSSSSSNNSSNSCSALGQAPAPLAGSGVALEAEVSGQLVAALHFGGFSSSSDRQAKCAELLDRVNRELKGEYRAKASSLDGGAPLLRSFVYNDPFTPPWKRRNEVVVDVVPWE
jgi:hypothetical protein